MISVEGGEYEEWLACLTRDPASWLFRITLIEEAVRRGDIGFAKKLVRDAPETSPIPEEYKSRIHFCFAEASLLPEQSVKVSSKLLLKQSSVVLAKPKEVTVAANEKLGAITIGLLAHLVILLVLILIKIVEPGVKQPRVYALAQPAVKEEIKPRVEKRSRMQRAAAVSLSPGTSAFAASNSFSGFSVTDIPDIEMDTTFTFDMDGSFGMGVEPEKLVDKVMPVQMRSRCSAEERLERIREAGGDERYEKVVYKGLNYLTAQQNQFTGAFGKEFSAAMTGLTLLSYLGHCETPASTKYGDSVMKAAHYLMGLGIKNKGLLVGRPSGSSRAYEHGIATYALIELHLMTRESGRPIPHLEKVINKAVSIIIETQTSRGGWPYYGQRDDDFSVSGWNIQALKSAKLAGLDVPGLDKSYRAATGRYTTASQDYKGAFMYRLNDGAGKKTLSGIGILSLSLSGNTNNRYYKRGIAFLADAYRFPNATQEYYSYYYTTQALFFHGQREWQEFGQRFLNQLIEHQKYEGYWLPDGSRYGSSDQIILQTNFAILMLEVGYRYLPTTSDVAEKMFRESGPKVD